jgi:hypothetical protein
MNEERNVGFQEQRKKRLEWLARYLSEKVPGEGINYGTVRSMLLNKWGLTPRKTEEYILIVIESQGFVLRDGKIVRIPSESRDG